MTLLTFDQMLRDMEEHLGIECMEYKGLTQTQRNTIILFEICRHIPKHTGPKKGEAQRMKRDGIIKL